VVSSKRVLGRIKFEADSVTELLEVEKELEVSECRNFGVHSGRADPGYAEEVVEIRDRVVED
jgi:hypothetical protein